jgi:bifunctional non-homologous end joining protein LigD
MPGNRRPVSRPKRRARASASPAKRSPASSTQVRIDPSALPGAKVAAQPDWIAPQLAQLATAAPDGDQWLHEIKYDGYRFIAIRQGPKAQLLTRNGKDWSAKFPKVVRAIAQLPVSQAIFDGELCVLNEASVSDFQALQNALHASSAGRMFYFLFDLLYYEGVDLRGCRLEDRKNLLATLLPKDDGSPLRLSDHMVGNGPETFRQACKLGVEGIVSKRADGRYESRRSPSWLKIKCSLEQEFVIGGYTDPQGGRTGFGALLLGYYEAGKLLYCGRVGTGFDTRTLESMTVRLKTLQQGKPPFANPPKGADAWGVHWVAPRLVAQVKYAGITSDGMLRHAAFNGLREDKKASEVALETPAKLRTEE